MAVEILVPLSCFAMIFGIVYIVVSARNRERMALIERGMNPDMFESKKEKSGSNILKWGLLMVGVALGSIAGGLLEKLVGIGEDTAYFSMIVLFGGAALILYYFKFYDKGDEKHRDHLQDLDDEELRRIMRED